MKTHKARFLVTIRLLKKDVSTQLLFAAQKAELMKGCVRIRLIVPIPLIEEVCFGVILTKNQLEDTPEDP